MALPQHIDFALRRTADVCRTRLGKYKEIDAGSYAVRMAALDDFELTLLGRDLFLPYGQFLAITPTQYPSVDWLFIVLAAAVEQAIDMLNEHSDTSGIGREHRAARVLELCREIVESPEARIDPFGAHGDVAQRIVEGLVSKDIGGSWILSAHESDDLMMLRHRYASAKIPPLVLPMPLHVYYVTETNTWVHADAMMAHVGAVHARLENEAAALEALATAKRRAAHKVFRAGVRLLGRCR